MSHSARTNSHASTACIRCRKKKRKCSGAGPTCVSCAEKNIQCEWTTETDGRRIAHNLQLENASLRAEMAELRALVDVLRAGALEELSYYAAHQTPDLDATPFIHMNAQHGAHTFAGTPPNSQLPGSSCLTLQGRDDAAAVGPSAEASDVQLNVFGPGVAPLYTGNVNLHG